MQKLGVMFAIGLFLVSGLFADRDSDRRARLKKSRKNLKALIKNRAAKRFFLKQRRGRDRVFIVPVSEESEKYPYKLKWMDRLYNRLSELRAEQIPFLIAGDFNVIPHDDDCHDPKAWDGDALFRQETHQKWRALLNLGLTDAFRVLHHDAGHYTFWDYQRGAWPQNKGIRIDHFLLSPALTDRLKSCEIDKELRGEDKASDHTPIILEIA